MIAAGVELHRLRVCGLTTSMASLVYELMKFFEPWSWRFHDLGFEGSCAESLGSAATLHAISCGLGSASNRRPLVGLAGLRTCVRFPLPLKLKDEMTLKSRGPIPFYYESLYVL